MRNRWPAVRRGAIACHRSGVGVRVRPRSRRRKAGLEAGVAKLLQIMADRAQGADGCEAGLGVAAMLLDVLGDQGLKQHTASAIKRPALHQEIGQGPALVGDPCGERGDQVVATDEVVLKGQDAEQQVATGPPLQRRLWPAARARLGAEVGADDPCVFREPVQVLLDGRPLTARRCLSSPLERPTNSPSSARRSRSRPPQPNNPRSAALSGSSRRPRIGRTPRPPVPTAAVGNPRNPATASRAS